MDKLRNDIADRLRTKSTLDEKIDEVLGQSKHIAEINSAVENPAIKKLISHFKKSVIHLQRQQNQLSESPEKHLEEIRSLNALRKVTENFVSFFNIPKQAKEEAYNELDRLRKQKSEAELRTRQNNRF